MNYSVHPSVRVYCHFADDGASSVNSEHTDILFFDQGFQFLYHTSLQWQLLLVNISLCPRFSIAGVAIKETGEPKEPFTFVGIYFEEELDEPHDAANNKHGPFAHFF